MSAKQQSLRNFLCELSIYKITELPALQELSDGDHLVVEQLSSESIGKANFLRNLGESFARCLLSSQQLTDQVMLACAPKPISGCLL